MLKTSRNHFVEVKRVRRHHTYFYAAGGNGCKYTSTVWYIYKNYSIVTFEVSPRVETDTHTPAAAILIGYNNG